MRLATALATREDREKFEAWLERQLEEEARARAVRKNGWWRNFWTDCGGDLLFAVCGLGVITALAVIYLALKTAGWFNL